MTSKSPGIGATEVSRLDAACMRTKADPKAVAESLKPGGDRSSEERQRSQAGQGQVADAPGLSALDRLVELARVERERDERVRKVLA